MGAVLVSLAFAIPQYVTARGQSVALERQQITEGLSKAVEQLGTRDNLEVRLGGIYVLERIARSSEEDHPAVINVLATFIRENTRTLRMPAAACSNQSTVAADIQAALDVLVRRNIEWDRPGNPIDLSRSCLQGANLSGANFANANLSGIDLKMANLSKANFSGSQLIDADLSGVNFYGADLSFARASNVNLSQASLPFALLMYTDLNRANLRGAFLGFATLINAYLTDADLTGANLTRANLTAADLERANLTNVTPGR